MSWIIDDVELSTLAFNVEERSAGWKVPSKRGDNLVIPGRNGAKWVPNKPFEVGSIVLSMWAVGALEDGTTPNIGAAKQVRKNLDRLTALFAQSQKLLNVVQISSVAYGVRNYFTNPSFSKSTVSDSLAYQNFIPNPSARSREEDAQFFNFFPNPNTNTVQQVSDPTRINQAPTPHFDYGLFGTAASGGVTLDTYLDPAFSDKAALRISPTGTQTATSAYPLGAPGGIMAAMGWKAGDTITVAASFRQPAVQTGTLDANARTISIGTVTGGVTNFSYAVSAVAPNTVNVSTRLRVTFTIPATADDVFIRLINGSQNVGEWCLWQSILVEKSADWLAYFDGDTLDTNDNIYSWSGTPGNSASTLVYTKTKMVTPIGYGNFYGGYTLTDRSWNTRIPAQVNLIKNSGASLFFSSELHEENDLDKYFLTQLQAADPDSAWALARGVGGIHCLYKSNQYVLNSAKSVQFVVGKSFMVFLFRARINGVSISFIGNDFQADDSDGTSQAAVRAKQATEEITYINSHTLPNLTVLGYLKSRTQSVGGPRDQFRKDGWLTLKERGAVTGGNFDTTSGTDGVDWTEEIYTKVNIDVSGSAEVPTSGASDHYAWLKTTLTYDVNTVLGYVRTYDNIMVDPEAQFPRQAPVVSTFTNFFAPSSFEGYAAGTTLSGVWTTGTNVTSTVVANTQADRTTYPGLGIKALQLLTTAALTNATLGNKPTFAFISGTMPLLRFKMRRYNNTTTTRTIQVRLITTTSGGTAGTTGSWQTFSVPSGNVNWTDVVYDSTGITSTSTNNYLQVQIRTGTEAWTSGDGILVDGFVVNAQSDPGFTAGYFNKTPGPYFDGGSSWIDTRYSTAGAPTTPSKWDYINDPRWIVSPATSAASAYYAFAQTPKQDPSGTSLSFHAMGFANGGNQQFTMETAAPTYIGQPYALRFSARAVNGVTCNVELLKQATSDPSPVSVGSVNVLGTAVSASTVGTIPVTVPPTGLKEFVKLTPHSSLKRYPIQVVAMDPVTKDLYMTSEDKQTPIENLWVQHYSPTGTFIDMMILPNGGHGTQMRAVNNGSGVFILLKYRNDYFVKLPWTGGKTWTKSQADAYKTTETIKQSGAPQSQSFWHQGETQFEDKYYRLNGSYTTRSPWIKPYMEIISGKKVIQKITLYGLGREGVNPSGALYGGRMEPEGITVGYINNYPVLLIGATVNYKNSTQGYQMQVYSYALPYSGPLTQPDTTGTNYGFVSGDFVDYSGPTYIPTAVTDRMFIRVNVPVQTYGNVVFQTNHISVSNATAPFDGDTLNDDDALYDWDGTIYNSKSIAFQRKVKYVIDGPNQLNSSVNPVGYPIRSSFVEFFSQIDDEDPSLTLEAQSIVGNNGLYFSVDALGLQYYDGDYFDNEVVKANVEIELLNASNAVVGTFTGATTQLNMNVDINDDTPTTDTTVVPEVFTNVPSTVFVQVPYESIPSTAVKARGTVNMVDSLRGTGIAFSKVMLLSIPISSEHMGKLAFFDGDSGDDYFWNGDSNDSVSGTSGLLPLRWGSVDGGDISTPTLVSSKGGPNAAGKPKITITTTIDAGLGEIDDVDPIVAGRYLFGFNVSAKIQSDLLNSTLPGAVNIQLQAWGAGVLINTFDVGTISGNVGTSMEPYSRVQGMVNITADFDAIRLVFQSSVTGDAILVQIKSAYLYLDNAYLPTQHLNVNKVANPYLYNNADQWTVVGDAVTSVTGGVYATRLSVGTTLTSNAFSVTAGDTLRFATWARNGVTPQIRFFGMVGDTITYPDTTFYPSATTYPVASSSSNGTIATVNFTPIIQTDFTTISSGTVTVPSGATTASVIYTATSSTSEISYSYVGVDYAAHEDDGYYNPTDYPYFDGSVPDFYASPTFWTGEQDNSASKVVPAIPAGWNYTLGGSNLHQVSAKVRPPSSTGRSGGILRTAPNSTHSYRTVGISRDSNTFLSGQVSVSALPGAIVTVGLYQAPNATDTGSLLWQQVLSSSSQEFVWNDLPISNNFIYFQITYLETVSAPGYRVWLDSLSFVMTKEVLGIEYPGYFDGNQGGGQWTGEANNSASQYYGGGRRALAEVTDAIDMTSMAGGTRAEFVVNMTIPDSFWEDLVLSTVDLDVENGELIDDVEYNLEALAGGTAPINDALITLTVSGDIEDMVIQDVATGGWLKIAGTLPETVVIDNENFTVTDADGNSLISKVTRGGSNQLVPVVPVSSVAPPRLKFSADPASTGRCSATIVARRRYVLS